MGGWNQPRGWICPYSRESPAPEPSRLDRLPGHGAPSLIVNLWPYGTVGTPPSPIVYPWPGSCGLSATDDSIFYNLETHVIIIQNSGGRGSPPPPPLSIYSGVGRAPPPSPPLVYKGEKKHYTWCRFFKYINFLFRIFTGQMKLLLRIIS